MTTLDVIYEDDWLTKTLKELYAANNEAKALRRRGFVGVAGSEYAKVHARIDALLEELEALT